MPVAPSCDNAAMRRTAVEEAVSDASRSGGAETAGTQQTAAQPVWQPLPLVGKTAFWRHPGNAPGRTLGQDPGIRR